MTVRQPRYSKEEHARRGTEIYDRQVQPQVEAGNEGSIVAIDVDSGDFEVAEDSLAALLVTLPPAFVTSQRYRLPAFTAAIAGVV